MSTEAVAQCVGWLPVLYLVARVSRVDDENYHDSYCNACMGPQAMKSLHRIFPALLFGVATVGIAAEQTDIDLLLQRLSEVEAQQARTQRVIADLRKQIEASGITPPAGGTVLPAMSEEVVVFKEGPQEPLRGMESRAMFPQLADESRFVLRTVDNEFELGIDGLLVGRAEYNYRSDDGSGSSEHDSGFETTATRINFRGHVHKDYGYWARLNADEFGSDPVFDALVGTYSFSDDTIMAVGQFPNLMTREQGLMVEKIQAVEATATNSVFDPFAFKGVIVGHHMPRTIVRGIVHDGYRSFANGFDEIDGPSADWAVAGQVVGMLIGDEGDWQRFNNITSRPGNTLAWQLNTAFSAQANPDIYLGILESSFEGDGWNIYTSGYYRDTDEDFDDVGGQDLGFVFQGGMWTGRHTEIYTRYDITRPDSDRPEEGDSFRTITAGLNYYPKPHTDSIKFQGELLYMLDPEAESLVQPDTLTSVRASPDGGQFVIRTQAQLRW